MHRVLRQLLFACICLGTSQLLVTCVYAGNTYHIDALVGDDVNTGLSPIQAWQSLDKVNSQVFLPGDRMRFKSGTQ